VLPSTTAITSGWFIHIYSSGSTDNFVVSGFTQPQNSPLPISFIPFSFKRITLLKENGLQGDWFIDEIAATQHPPVTLSGETYLTIDAPNQVVNVNKVNTNQIDAFDIGANGFLRRDGFWIDGITGSGLTPNLVYWNSGDNIGYIPEFEYSANQIKGKTSSSGDILLNIFDTGGTHTNTISPDNITISDIFGEQILSLTPFTVGLNNINVFSPHNTGFALDNGGGFFVSSGYNTGGTHSFVVDDRSKFSVDRNYNLSLDVLGGIASEKLHLGSGTIKIDSLSGSGSKILTIDNNGVIGTQNIISGFTLNNLTGNTQFLVSGDSGNDFNIISTNNTHAFNLPVATSGTTGKLSSTDWVIFNNKLNKSDFDSYSAQTLTNINSRISGGSSVTTGTTFNVAFFTGSTSILGVNTFG